MQDSLAYCFFSTRFQQYTYLQLDKFFLLLLLDRALSGLLLDSGFNYILVLYRKNRQDKGHQLGARRIAGID